MRLRGRVGLIGAALGAALTAPLAVWAWPDEAEQEAGAVPTDLRERDPQATPAARRV
ncbi:hypothetical protein [Streptomyces sp. NPDC001020]